MSNTTAPLRKLGQHGATIPAIGLGLMGLSVFYGKPGSNEERFTLLDKALELGAVHWDSSDLYGDSEQLLGQWFKRTGKRDQIFLASKFGFSKGFVDPTAIDSSAEYCKKACAASLSRIGTDYIDLYYMHRANPDTPIEETMRAMVDLKNEGKIKYIGLSEVSSNTLRRACKIAHVDAVQIEYSPFVLDVENSVGTHLLKTCRELGVAVVCYSPLGRGLLTGALTTKESIKNDGDWRSMMPRFNDENFDRNVKLVNQFKELADKKGCTPAQLSIAWLLKQGDDIIPIPGTKKIEYLEENWNSFKIDLTDDDEKEIRNFIEAAEIAGHRGAPGFTDTVEEI
ncbi:Aldo-keto reductase yakc [Fusarium oxysporum f. sp. cubense]|uniref:Aldo-keto reductase yakc n=1 Tax=Fusarium oxysporum f. sp. cubense TaxID=61366 RepID=A0A559L8U9_FUSOC|nr:Aldo-keto reductase yakc [Fusarium oxysporum f. sp. cubense]